MSLPAPERVGISEETCQGFVVADMVDVDLFRPTEEAKLPSSGVYLVTDIQRGDEFRNWSPEESKSALLLE